MAKISESKVFTESWNTVFAKLEGITDPEGKTKWVFSAFPEKGIDKPASYPLIVLTPTDISNEPFTFKSERGPMRFTIDVYTTKASELDSVCDDVAGTMKTNLDDGSFALSGIHTMRLVSTSYGHFSRNALRVHNKTLHYEFDYGWF